MMTQKNYDMVDLTKLGMAFLIVALHCSTGGLNVIGRLGVPFFFMASSYFFFQKYLAVDVSQQFTLLKRYLKRLFYLYIAWQIIYLPSMFYTVQEGFKELGGGAHPFVAMKKIQISYLLSGQYDGWGQSWYLFASAYGLILITWLRRYLKDGVLLGLGIVFEIYFVIRFSIRNTVPDWYDFTFTRAIFYLMIGLFLAKYPQILAYFRQWSTLKLTAVTTVAGLLFVIEAYGLNWLHGTSKTAEVAPLTAIVAVIIFIWSMAIPWKIPYARELRMMSTFIYCFHVLLIRVIFVALKIHFANNYRLFMATALICVLVFMMYDYYRKQSDKQWLRYLV